MLLTVVGHVGHGSTCLSARLSEMDAWCYITVLCKYNDVKRCTHLLCYSLRPGAGGRR